jgi:hypothetical protein
MPGGSGMVTHREIELIPRPDMHLIWQNLGFYGQEIIDKVLLIDKLIYDIKRLDNLNINYTINKLTEITSIIELLDQELENEAQGCNSVLTD